MLVAGLTGEEMKSVLQIFSTNRKVRRKLRVYHYLQSWS